MLTRPRALLILPPPHISASSLPLLILLHLSKPLPLPRLDVQGDDAVVPLELLLPPQVPLLDLLVVVIRKLLIPWLLTATAATSIPHPDACDTLPFTFLFGFLRLHKRKSPNVQFCGRGNGNQTSLFEIGTPRVHLYTMIQEIQRFDVCIISFSFTCDLDAVALFPKELRLVEWGPPC